MFEHCLYFNTTSLARLLEREWTAAFKPFGLTPSQAFMLRAVLAKHPISGTDLARQLNISKPTCTRIMEGLLKLGMLERTADDQDGRTIRLYPTPSAMDLHHPLTHAGQQVTQRLKAQIGEAEFTHLVQQMRDVQDLMR